MIKDIYNKKQTVLSFEVFPPKLNADISVIYNALDQLKFLSPDFISVTYGAGGGTRETTTEIATYIEKQCDTPALAHLTCVALNEINLLNILEDFNKNNIQNILALRGDKPKDMSIEDFERRFYPYASDMISTIKDHYNFCVGGACYPEKHVDAPSMEQDIQNLYTKVQAGAEFLITQLFFDNHAFYNFMDKATTKGIYLPISVGIMPIISARQIGTSIALSGSTIPKNFQDILDKYGDNPDDMRKAGIDYAINQIQELIQWKVRGVHIYTMNKVDLCKEIVDNISI